MTDIGLDMTKCILSGCKYFHRLKEPYIIGPVMVDAECTNPDGACWQDIRIRCETEDEKYTIRVKE